MHLTGFTRRRYRPFEETALTFDPAPGRINLVLASNGAGESILRQAFQDLLLGIGGQTSMGFRHRYPGPADHRDRHRSRRPPSASTRRKGNQNTLLGENDAPLHQAWLDRLLGRADGRLVSRPFALDKERLRQSHDNRCRPDDGQHAAPPPPGALYGHDPGSPGGSTWRSTSLTIAEACATLRLEMVACRERVQSEDGANHLIAEHLTDVTPFLNSVGRRDRAFPLPQGCGNEAHHGDGPDQRKQDGLAGRKPRDICIPDFGWGGVSRYRCGTSAEPRLNGATPESRSSHLRGTLDYHRQAAWNLHPSRVHELPRQLGLCA